MQTIVQNITQSGEQHKVFFLHTLLVYSKSFQVLLSTKKLVFFFFGNGHANVGNGNICYVAWQSLVDCIIIITAWIKGVTVAELSWYFRQLRLVVISPWFNFLWKVEQIYTLKMRSVFYSFVSVIIDTSNRDAVSLVLCFFKIDLLGAICFGFLMQLFTYQEE